MDLKKETESGIIFSLSLKLQDRALFVIVVVVVDDDDIFDRFSGSNSIHEK